MLSSLQSQSLSCCPSPNLFNPKSKSKSKSKSKGLVEEFLKNPSTPQSSALICCCSSPSTIITQVPAPPNKNKRNRFRKPYPGESKGIVEEMRFVAMRLRNDNTNTNNDNDSVVAWKPTMDGFVKYLVDSKLVFHTVEKIIHDSTDVSYTYFRNTGLERTACIAKDLEWLEKQGIVIPQPSSPGLNYAIYLAELADKSAPLFLSNLYNIYFAHISGGQAIGKQVRAMLLQGKELEFYKWERDELELMSDVREKLNNLGEHWSRDEKNKCLREAAKAFKFSGQIVRLIIL